MGVQSNSELDGGGMTTTLHSDDLWLHLERLGRRSPRVAAIAYVSAPIFRFGSGDVVITDASRAAISSGQTSAQLLLDAVRRGAKAYSLPRLHAKILLSDGAAMVGSANLSDSSRALSEAGILTTDSRLLRSIRSHLKTLQRRARLLSVPELRRLAAIPVIRTPRRPNPTTPQRPSLFEALREQLPSLDTLAFMWYEVGGELTREQVKEAALGRKVPLPFGRRWSWYESRPSRGCLSRTRNLCDGRALIAFQGRCDRKGVLRGFKAHDNPAAPFIDALLMKKLLVTIVSDAPAKTSFDIRRDRRSLATTLSRGLERAPRRLRALVTDDKLGLVSLKHIRELYALGRGAF